MNEAKKEKAKFPATFWTANTIELFERAAYYSMSSFMVVYLNEVLGMSPAQATRLNGSLLWGLIYFMPVLSGTLADKYGYKRSLTVSFFMISLGYFIMGNLQRLWPGLIGLRAAETIDYTVPAVLGIILIGIGGSIVKPCIAGTVQKTAGRNATLAFGVFYTVINIGSITGRGFCYLVRTQWGIPAIFTYVATVFSLIGLAIVIFIYREPHFVSDGLKDGQVVREKTLGRAILGIFTALKNIKFVLFLIVMGLFWFLYSQLYNLMPLFLRFLDPKASVELYTLANPVMIVCFQLLITRTVKKWTPIKSMLAGVTVTTAGMLVNIAPPLLFSDLSAKVGFSAFAMPAAGIFLIVSIASMAVGEMMASPRVYEYLGGIAPKGEEGLYMGYTSLPVAIGSIMAGQMGGSLFERYISNPVKAGQPVQALKMWLIVAGMGVLSMIGLMIYDRLLIKGGGSRQPSN
ncbi:MAG TPA: MFS transporter [Candidatus Aminicenantes bacterium]|nr:MFS transporter [Candidatus Aminicenantes bacterium]